MTKFQSPAYHLIIETAKNNWWLITTSTATNILSAILEGSTLGVIYLAISYLTETTQTGEISQKSKFLITLKSNLNLPPDKLFLSLICCAVLLQIFLSLSNYANRVSVSYLSAKAQPYITGKVFERIMSFSYGCVSRYKVGDLVLFTNDASSAVDQQIKGLNNILVSLSFAVVYIFVIIRLSPMLAIAAAFLTIVVIFVQYRLIPQLRIVAKQVSNTRVEAVKWITESIQGLRLIHTFGTQKSTIDTASYRLDKMRLQLQKRAFIFYLPEPILESLPVIALAILASFAVLSENDTETILPMLLTFLLALQRLSVRLKAVAASVTGFSDNSGRMLRLEAILSEKDKEIERSGSQPLTELKSDILFQNVGLSYNSDSTFALKNLTFSLPRSKVTALVGESGAGKSSIIDLLIGIYRPTVGQILVNESTLEDYQIEDWRRNIGVVSQDTFIFNNNILENLRYGRPEATFDEVVEAARAAQAHVFILELSEGYETVVGERGYRLSGGQRQRLALARALIKQPEILILDEATSALDSESEKLIQQALEKFQEERTVIVVAHRLSTIAKADQILVLDQGQIVERGTHHLLLQQGGRYARYWKLQSNQIAA